MKVAMVTPMSPESAIADVMTQAIPTLSSRWDLEIWCPSEPAYRPCPVPVHTFVQPDADVLAALAAYDLVVYVLGDSPWHSRILPLARRLPGLVVLHDASLTNLVRQTTIEQDEMEQLLRRIERQHSEQHAETFRTASPSGGPGAWLRYCAEVPLTEVAVEAALGAVVHSSWHAARVDGLLLGEVTVAPLPVPSTRMGFESNQNHSSSQLLQHLPADDLLLVTVGSVNSNRRIELLLEAIAEDDTLATRLHLWAVGPADDKARADLQRIAAALGLQDRFAVTGRVTDALLQDILARADMAAALRDPVLEGQSASVLTQLLSGTPVIVYDHAHYSELPDEVVIKVDPADGGSGIRTALRTMVDDEHQRMTRGQLSRDYVLSSRSGPAYAAALLEAGDRALASRPLIHLNADLATRLRRLDLHKEPPVVAVITELAFELFDLA